MHAVAVELAGRDVVEIGVPDILGALRQLDTLELAAALHVEQAQLDLLRVGGEQREIGAASVPASAEACGRSSSQAHRSAFRNEEDRGERRNGEPELAIDGVDFADVADIAAAVMGGVRVEHFLPLAAEGRANAVVAIDVG